RTAVDYLANGLVASATGAGSFSSFATAANCRQTIAETSSAFLFALSLAMIAKRSHSSACFKYSSAVMTPSIGGERISSPAAGHRAGDAHLIAGLTTCMFNIEHRHRGRCQLASPGRPMGHSRP